MDNSPFSPFIARHRTIKDYKRRQSQLPSDLIDWDAPEIPELEKQRIIYEQIIQECNEDHVIESLINEEVFMVAHEVLVESSRKQYEEASQKDRSQINLVLGQLKLFESQFKEMEERLQELVAEKEKLVAEREELVTLKEKFEEQNRELGPRCDKLESINQELESQNKEMGERIQGLAAEKEKLEEQNRELGPRCDKLESVNQELENQTKLLEERNRDLEFHKQKFEELSTELGQRCEKLESVYQEIEFHKQELEAEVSCRVDMLIHMKSERDDLKKRLEGAHCRLAYCKQLTKMVTN